jgi:hypothetical protein
VEQPETVGQIQRRTPAVAAERNSITTRALPDTAGADAGQQFSCKI